MALRAPAAEHLEAELGAQPHLQTARIPVGSVAQRFEYERESRLELLRVTRVESQARRTARSFVRGEQERTPTYNLSSGDALTLTCI
eukprot:1060085-Prymnesium_polylepis.1